MSEVKQELLKMLNKALELEHAARIQYLTHAEQVKGLYAEQVIDQLHEIASDEEKHEGKFRDLIGNFFGGVPSMSMAQTYSADNVHDILDVNLNKGEKVAIDYYKQIYRVAVDNKNELQYEFETLEHELRHIILDEEEHASELSLLLGD